MRLAVDNGEREQRGLRERWCELVAAGGRRPIDVARHHLGAALILAATLEGDCSSPVRPGARPTGPTAREAARCGSPRSDRTTLQAMHDAVLARPAVLRARQPRPEAGRGAHPLDSGRYRRTPWKNGGGVAVTSRSVSARPRGRQLGRRGLRFGQTGSSGRAIPRSPVRPIARRSRGRGLSFTRRRPAHRVRALAGCLPGSGRSRAAEDGPVAVVEPDGGIRRRAAVDLRFARQIARLRVEPGTLVLYAVAEVPDRRAER